MLGLMAGCTAACGISMALAYTAHKKAWEAGIETECLKAAIEERLDFLADEIERLKAAKGKAAKGGKKC